MRVPLAAPRASQKGFKVDALAETLVPESGEEEAKIAPSQNKQSSKRKKSNKRSPQTPIEEVVDAFRPSGQKPASSLTRKSISATTATVRPSQTPATSPDLSDGTEKADTVPAPAQQQPFLRTCNKCQVVGHSVAMSV